MYAKNAISLKRKKGQYYFLNFFLCPFFLSIYLSRNNPALVGKHVLDTLGFFLQQKYLMGKSLLILLHFASIDTTHFQRVVSTLLSTTGIDYTHLQKQQIQQLTILQRLSIFETTFRSSTPNSVSDQIRNGTQLSEEEYFQHCKQLIEDRRVRGFGMLRILDMVNQSTVDLLIQFLKFANPIYQSTGDAMEYILFINSQQWREIGIQRKQALLNTLEGLKSDYPNSEEWFMSSYYDQMDQAIVKLSFLLGNNLSLSSSTEN